ncbi:hypothetical protein QJ854_gp863 [Moumouvirus goulette]|uniref:Uncharacterized protein n=1 Tax=Moumouvirus goulette TaxID=1247379 RepID=M1PAR2_9VIRU|nr:hypothetical protein QJ854_gp863 [Moumouvirus goulette]AGF84919.1 hypothetical protein glt_00110 [Moumouvirus goulette]
MDQLQDSSNFVTGKMVPSLTFIIYRTIVETQNSCTSHYLLSTIPDSVIIKPQQIYTSRDLIIKRIIKISRKFPVSYIFGGFHRDLFAKMPFKDIDISFLRRRYAIDFIQAIQSEYFIKFLKPSYNSRGCFTICVQEMNNPQINVHFDVVYEMDDFGDVFLVKYFDFDVNMLESHKHTSSTNYSKYLRSSNSHCNVKNIIDNCVKKQFIVLDYYGRPEIIHNPEYIISFDLEGNVLGLKRHNILSKREYKSSKSECNCINRQTSRGKKLLLRIKKMKSRGWSCLNEKCMNPLCIMAPTYLYQKYNEYIKVLKE